MNTALTAAIVSALVSGLVTIVATLLQIKVMRAQINAAEISQREAKKQFETEQQNWQAEQERRERQRNADDLRPMLRTAVEVLKAKWLRQGISAERYERLRDKWVTERRQAQFWLSTRMEEELTGPVEAYLRQLMARMQQPEDPAALEDLDPLRKETLRRVRHVFRELVLGYARITG
jgi:hypothetical protein